MRRIGAFTLFEILLAVFIASLMLLIAIPSISGVISERRMRQSFEKFDELARAAQNLSLREQRAYLLVWEKKLGAGEIRTVITLRPEELRAQGETGVGMYLEFGELESYDLELPAALDPVVQKAWMFWPNGTCEPATVSYKGQSGGWIARYNPLTTQPAFSQR